MDHWLVNLLALTPTGETAQHLYEAAAVMTGRDQGAGMLGTLCSFEGYGMRGFRVRRLALDPGLSVNHRARPIRATSLQAPVDPHRSLRTP